MKDLSTCTSTG